MSDYVVFLFNLHSTSLNEEAVTSQSTPSTETVTSFLSNENPVPLITKFCPLIEPSCVVELTRGRTTN
jgi:hypothetical protein